MQFLNKHEKILCSERVNTENWFPILLNQPKSNCIYYLLTDFTPNGIAFFTQSIGKKIIPIRYRLTRFRKDFSACNLEAVVPGGFRAADEGVRGDGLDLLLEENHHAIHDAHDEGGRPAQLSNCRYRRQFHHNKQTNFYYQT